MKMAVYRGERKVLNGAEVSRDFRLNHVEPESRPDSGQIESPDRNAGQNLLPGRKGKFLAVIVHGWWKIVFDVLLLNLIKGCE